MERGGRGGGVKNGITSGRIGYFWPDGNLEGRRPALQVRKMRKWSSSAGNRRSQPGIEGTGENRRRAEGIGRGMRLLPKNGRKWGEKSCWDLNVKPQVVDFPLFVTTPTLRGNT